MSSLEFKKIDETRNYILEEVKHNDLMSVKHKMICKYLNYNEHLLVLASTITDCVSISEFTSLVGIHAGITSSVVGLKSVQSLQELKSISQLS